MQKRFSLIFTCITAILTSAPVLAGEVNGEYIDDGGPLPFGYVRSVDAFVTSNSTANSLGLAAEYATARGYFEDAIRICRMALKKNDDDLDVHQAYAQALEGKLALQKEKDPELQYECVREWLIVLRTERGPEKGINGKNGLGLPGMNKLYEDEEHSMVAQVHLKSLVGSVPKRKETNDHYMVRTCGPASLNVYAKILKSQPANPASAPGNGTAPAAAATSTPAKTASTSTMWMK